MPFLGNPQVSSGILRVWIGEVGTWVFAIFVLLSSIAVHFSFGTSKCRTALHLITKMFSFPQKNKNTKETPKVTKEVEQKTESSSPKKPFWSFILPTKVASQQDPLFRDVSQQDTTNEGFSKPANKVKKLTNKKSIVDDTDGLKDPEKDSPKQEILPSKEEKGVKDDNLEKVSLDDGFKVVRAEKTEKATDLFPERKGDYHFPTLDLLMEPPEISSGEMRII